ncbi:M23 family metallopeptidase [Sphingomonas sp. dw_22]|uniref:M23 family metallopeptidase n=1 Tax=Sphingomonas sp. dw_22 TaxID=2721175 RepID=UPI00211600AE|nr:M23 family metallopeptidase [Sphingomonas sp. dw_22]
MPKRIGWGLGLFMLLIAAAFASMVRVRFDPPVQAVNEPLASSVAGEASLMIPVRGVRADQLTDTWGQSRASGQREHHAIDILAPKGTPVLAAAGGTIEKIFESADGGHTIYVRTADGGTIHYYAHLDSYGVGEGQQVRQGQRIATVGDTGNAAGGAPHLHFEIKLMQPGQGWWEGTNVNPYPLLAGVGNGG